MKRKNIIPVLALLLCGGNAIAQDHQTTIYDSTSVCMEESGLSHVTNHQRIRMNDFSGCANNNVVKLDYDPPSAYVQFNIVLVHRAKGATDTIYFNDGNGHEKGSVYDYVAPARLIYWGASQKMVEIGHLNPQDEIEFSSYRKGFTYALLGDDDSRYIPPMRGHFYDIVPFWSLTPIKEKIYTINVPKSKTLQYKVYHDSEKNPVVVTTQDANDRIIYTFDKKAITPIKEEPNMLAHNDIECKLLLSTAPNWESKSQWFYNVNEDYGSFNPTPELTAKVNELLAPAKTELDSISILTHWVADNMRYAGISMGEGEGYTLHNAEMNFTDRCGVCKDKASLLIAMLRAAGFNAYAAMTMAHERIDDIPADQFNHSVCVVQHRNGEYELLDPTWVPNVRELWSSAEQQQGYLMGLPQGATLEYTPITAPEKNYLRITNKAELQSDGTLEGEITITAEGQSDKAVRGVFAGRQIDWRKQLDKEFLAIAPNAEIRNITYTDNDNYLEQPVKITYSYRIPYFATITKKECIFTPLAARNFFKRAMPHLNIKDLKQRQYPFADDYSHLVEISDTITLPQEYSQLHFPQIFGVADPAASFGCQYWIDGNKLIFAESLVFGKRIYEAKDWPMFRECVKNQNILASTPVVLTK